MSADRKTISETEDDTVEGHLYRDPKVRDTGEVSDADDESVEGHAINHRPLDGLTGQQAGAHNIKL